MIESLTVENLMKKNKYFIEIFKGSQKEIIILSLKIWIPILLITILVKYCLKRKHDIRYLVMALWSYYLSSVIYITTVGRNYRSDVWDKLHDGWGLESKKDLLYAAENMIMLFPLTFLLLIGIGRIYFKKANFINTVILSLAISYACSLTIECVQAKYGLGTFQISDLVYNTLGGTFGGVLYLILTYIRSLLDKILNRK